MAISRSPSFTVPAVAEKSFDSVWVRNINIHCPQLNAEGNNEGNINIELMPYDATEGSEAIHFTIDNEGVEYINVPNRANGRKTFWECVNEVPEVAAAMEAIVAAVGPLKTWAETAPVVEEPVVEEPVVEEEAPTEEAPTEEAPTEEAPTEEAPE
jgi:hypothetical protein